MPQHKILVFDPGESTGWVGCTREGQLMGGTCKKNHLEVAQLIEEFTPDIIVLERFNLYPSMAKTLAWNSFYPCEVIGIIKYLAMRMGVPIIEQAPSIKKYYGGQKEDWLEVKECVGVTEHTKDAYMHYRYFLLNGYKKF